MLSQLLGSMPDCDQVVIADDGSDFDVRALAKSFDLPDLTFVVNDPKPVQNRMLEASCGRMMNRATNLVKCDYLIPVCDDDLLAEDWPRQAAAGLDYYQVHMVRGDWRLITDDGLMTPEQIEAAKANAPLCRFVFDPPLTTGNFAYRKSCATEEDCTWNERTLAVHDATMLAGYISKHNGALAGKKPWLGSLDVLAGWRRDHPKTVTRHARSNDTYTRSAEELFSAQSME